MESKRIVDGVDISDPTAAAIAAASGKWAHLEEDLSCMYNFMEVTDKEIEEDKRSEQSLSEKIKRQAAKLKIISRAFKETEQTLDTASCTYRNVNQYEEMMAATFEPLREVKYSKGKVEIGTRIDRSLEKHREKYNYMVIDNMRIAISSLLQKGDTRECVLYLCDRRIEDPILGALALIVFKLPGMSTHVYKTGRILAFSRRERLASEHLQLYVYIKGARMIKHDNAPITVNMKTSILFCNNAEAALQHPSSLDTEGNIVTFLTENQDLFAWTQSQLGSGLAPASLTSQHTHTSRLEVLRRWNNPVGNISRRMALPLDRQSIVGGSSGVDVERIDPEDDCDVVGRDRLPSREGRLRIGTAQSGIQTTTPDSTIHSVESFVQDSEIPAVVASLEQFMAKQRIDGVTPLVGDQFSRPVFVETFTWSESKEEGTEIFSLELPGDVVTDHSRSLYNDLVQRAFCFKNDYKFHIMIAGNEGYTGALKVCIDHNRRLFEASRDDNLVYHSMEGPTLMAQDTNGLEFSVNFSSIHNHISAHDMNSHNALFRLSFRVIHPLGHQAMTAPTITVTLQVYAVNIEVKHTMWRSLETTFPVSMGSHIPSIVGEDFGRRIGSSAHIFHGSTLKALITQRAYLGSLSIKKDVQVRALVMTAAIHPMSSRVENGVLLLSQLAAISSLYTFWRGSLVLTFELNCSSTTRGKLVLSLAPKGGVSMPSMEAAFLGPGSEFDLGTSTCRSFTIPFISTDDWETIGDGSLMSAFEGVWDCPVARLVVMHPVTSSYGTTPDVSVRMYLEPGPDFQLRGPRSLSLQTVSRPLGIGTGQSGALNLVASRDFALSSVIEVEATQDWVTIQIPVAPWYSKKDIDYTLLENPLHWASRFFCFWRGSIEYRIVLEADALGDGSESAISLWHNPTTQFKSCVVESKKTQRLSKEGYYGKKISLKQTFCVDILAEDDQRFGKRLCKVMDTHRGEETSSSSSSVGYTGHPALSSHLGALFLEIPKNCFDGKVYIYNRAGPDFEFLTIGGVPSLKTDKMPRYKKPTQPYTNKTLYVDGTNGIFEEKPPAKPKKIVLATGVAQGKSSVGGFISSRLSQITTWSAPPDLFRESWLKPYKPCENLNPSESELLSIGVMPTVGAAVRRGGTKLISALDEGKTQFQEMVTKVFEYLKTSVYDVVSGSIKGALGSMLSTMMERVRDAVGPFLDKVREIFKECLGDPICLGVVGIAISALCGYSALKLMEGLIPNALGVFSSLLSVVSAAVCAIYWPKGMLSVLSGIANIKKRIVESCEELYKLFFCFHDLPEGTDEAAIFSPPGDVEEDDKVVSANANTKCADDSSNLADGVAHGRMGDVFGALAFIKLFVTFVGLCDNLCESPFNVSSLERNCRKVSGIGGGVKTIVDFKNYLFRTLMDTLTPSSNYVKISKHLGFDLREWFDDIERLTLQEERYTDLDNPEKIDMVRHLYDKGVKVMGSLMLVESSHLARACERSFKLAKELLDETHRVKGVSGVRVDPFHVSLYGAPGTGKSFVMSRLLNDMLDFMGEPRCDRSYSKTPDEAYWSGYIGQTAVKCDDLGQDLSKGYSPTYGQIIQMKTNNCFIVPMADLANKGRTFTSKYIFSTTNVRGCGSKHGLAEPDAFLRRRNLMVEVTNSGERVDGSLENMRFTFLNPLVPTENNPKYPPRLKYTDFLCACVAEAKIYMNSQEKVLETLRSTSSGASFGDLTPEVQDIIAQVDPSVAKGLENMLRVSSYLKDAQDCASTSEGPWLDDFKESFEEPPTLSSEQQALIRDLNLYLPESCRELGLATQSCGMECGESDNGCNLRDGVAHMNSYSSFIVDDDGQPLPSPFVKMYADMRLKFAQERKILLTDMDLHHFGVLMTMGNFEAFITGEIHFIPEECDRAKIVHFFRYMFDEALIYQREEDILKKFPITTSMMIQRLVNETQCSSGSEVKPGDRLSLIDDYDKELLKSLSLAERTAYHYCLLLRRTKQRRSWTISERLSLWFEKVKSICSSVLEALPATVKIILVLATSFGALYGMVQGFKSLKGAAGSIVGSIFGRSRTQVTSNDTEGVLASLEVLLAHGKKKKPGNKNPYLDSGDELTQRWERMQERARLATGVSHGGMVAQATEDCLGERQGYISNIATHNGLVATNIGGGLLLMPLHIFSNAIEGDMMQFEWRGEKFFFPFSSANVGQVLDYDLCVYDTNLAVPARSMRLSIFMDERELDKFTDLECSFALGPNEQGSGAKIVEKLVAKREKTFRYTVDGVLIVAVHGWSVCHQTFPGQCGSFLVSQNERACGKVFGMLVAGCLDKAGSHHYGTYVPVTKQGIVAAIESLRTPGGVDQGVGQSSLCEIPIPEKLKNVLKLDALITTESVKGRYGPFTAGKSIGVMQVVGATTAAGNLTSNTKSTIMKSLIQSHMPRKPLTEPAILTGSDPRLPAGVTYDPLLDGIKKYSELATPTLPSWRKKILTCFKSDIDDWERHLLRPDFPAPLSMEIIINGIDNSPYYESLNMSTSEGFPLILRRPKEEKGKRWLFSFNEDTEKYAMEDAQLRSSYGAYHEALEKGQDFPLLCIECPKDERRPLDKVYAHPKTRLFSNLPVEFNMHARRLFLDFNVFTMANRHRHGIMVGINPHSREWSDLAMDLASFSPVGFNGDFANFDGKFHPDAFMMVSEIADYFYGDGLTTERVTLTRALTNRISLVKGAAISIPGGGPSGFPMTVIFNSYINLFYLMSAWCELARRAERTDIADPLFFRKYVRAFVYGDDNIVSIKQEVIDWYNLCTVSAFLSDYYGVTLTDGEKNAAASAKPYANILSFDFLKRGFRSDESIPSLFHAPLHKRSIEEQVYWIRQGGDEWENLKDNIENALYEAHHHGREYFQSFRNSIQEALAKIGRHSEVLPNFTFLRQRWITQDLGEGASSMVPRVAGQFRTSARVSVEGEELNRERSSATHIPELMFSYTKDSLGGELVTGALQKVFKSFWIGPSSSLDRNSPVNYDIIIDNSLSSSQSRMGFYHGLGSCKKPHFEFLRVAAPALQLRWPCRVLSVSVHGGIVDLATVCFLSHFTNRLHTNQLCVLLRKYYVGADKLLASYFRYISCSENRIFQKNLFSMIDGTLHDNPSDVEGLVAARKGELSKGVGQVLNLTTRVRGSRLILD
nr:MAG: polyprotein (domains: capsid, helicase, peptidase, RdRP) [Plant associated sequivirus 1]